MNRRSRLQQIFSQPFAAGLLGGLVVLVAGAIAVEAGWIGKEERTTLTQAIPSSGAQEASGGLTINQIYRKDGPGVVFVSAQIERQTQSVFGLPEQERGQATGSGFVIDDDGHILTNAHVVEGASDIEVRFGDQRIAEAKLVGRDESNDVALLKIKGSKSLHALTLGDSSKLEVGDSVVAIGNPFGLDRTVTSGIVSALARQITAPNGFTIQDVIQTDAAINPGNSGGPLIGGQGGVIGINSQIATAGGGGSVGIGFAVPINKVKEIAKQLKEKGKVERAYLGVTGVSITPSLANRLNLATEKGALVQQVTGPARKAGVKGGDTQVTIDGQELVLGGDVITAIDGKQVNSMNDVIGYVDTKKPGDAVTLKLTRGTKTREVKVKLATRPASADVARGGQDRQQQPELPPNLVP